MSATNPAVPIGSESRPLVAALRRRPRLRAGLVQLTYIVLGIALGVLVAQITAGPTIGTDRLSEIAAGITTGMIALTSVVFALLFLVIQHGSTTHTPRLNVFRDSLLVAHSFGFFLGTIAFIFATELAVKPAEPVSVLVPGVGCLLVLVSLGVARQLQLRALNSVQLAPVLYDVAARGRVVIDQLYPDPDRPDSPADAVTPPGDEQHSSIRWPSSSAVLQQIDLPRLLAVAERLNALVVVTVGVGEMLWEQETIIRVFAVTTPADERDLLTAIEGGIERSFQQDPLLALRLLTDIGLRALSSAINDPFTTIQSIDAIEGLLRRLITRQLEVAVVRDDAGEPRVNLLLPSWEQFVQAGIDELMFAGRSNPTVRRRLLALVDSLLPMGLPARRPALERRRAELVGPTPAAD